VVQESVPTHLQLRRSVVVSIHRNSEERKNNSVGDFCGEEMSTNQRVFQPLGRNQYLFICSKHVVFGALLNIIAIIGHGSVDNDTEYIVQQFIMRWLTVILVQKSDVTSSRVNRMWKAIATHGCRGGLRELSKRSPWNGQESVF